MSKTRPDFLIIGGMKCATTTLHAQLARQPGIFMSEPKEPCFFSDDPEYARGLDWYAGLFTPAEPGALCGESSTNYTKLPTYPKTIERLRQYVPDPKLIYLMRHPIARLLSQYVHEWTRNAIREPIDKALDLYPELIAYSKYSMQLKPYLETFGRQRVLPIFFERLTSDPRPELERVCRFIGYPGSPRWDDTLEAKNVSKELLRLSPWRDRLVEQPILRALRRALVPKVVRERVKKLWKVEPRLPEATADRLRAIFDEDLANLSSWLGFEITCATWKDVAAKHLPTFGPGPDTPAPG